MRENRDLMVELCITNDLRITNTMYRKRPEKLATYRKYKETDNVEKETFSADTHEQIDYILVPRRWRNIVKDAESDTEANINTDHYPVIAHIRIRLGKRRRERDKQGKDTNNAQKSKENN